MTMVLAAGARSLAVPVTQRISAGVVKKVGAWLAEKGVAVGTTAAKQFTWWSIFEELFGDTPDDQLTDEQKSVKESLFNALVEGDVPKDRKLTAEEARALGGGSKQGTFASLKSSIFGSENDTEEASDGSGSDAASADVYDQAVEALTDVARLADLMNANTPEELALSLQCIKRALTSGDPVNAALNNMVKRGKWITTVG